MRRDWHEVGTLAREVDNKKWQYRTQGELGFADFYDGDLAAPSGTLGALIAASNVRFSSCQQRLLVFRGSDERSSD